MNRYLVFGGPTYYPSGGMDDFEQDFKTLKIAKAFTYYLAESRCFDWVYVYDQKQKGVVFNFIIE